MDKAQAIRRLQEMYEAAAARKERSIAPILFGIRYADELAHYSTSELKRIAFQATGYASYETEIGNGRRLAQYVQWREPP